MKIDIVIPNYNGSHLIEKNLPSVLKAHNNYIGKIIVVDDGSKVDDKNNLKRIIKDIKSTKIRLIEHDVNKGFSSAVNTGAKVSDANFIIFLNSDVRPKENFIKPLIEKMKDNTDYFGIGCLDESVEKDKIIKRGRGIGYWSKGMVLHKKGEVNKSDTFWISGGSCMVRRKIFEQLGGFDPLYNPFYWEDIDISYRAVKSGYKISFDNSSIVTHFHEEGAIKTGFEEGKITKIAYRNQFIFIWKNITSTHLLINHLLYVPLNMINAFIRFDVNFIMGFLLALLQLPAIMKKRNLQKKHYKISDVSILNHIS